MPAKCKAVNRSLLYPETPMQAQAKYLRWDLHIYTGKKKRKTGRGELLRSAGKIYKMQPQPQYDRNAIDNTMHHIK